jgi:ATP-dependent Clp protease ATP-binding subunit ClpX
MPSPSEVNTNSELCCSFCGKPQHAVKQLVVGQSTACICNECIKACMKIVEEEGQIS